MKHSKSQSTSSRPSSRLSRRRTNSSAASVEKSKSSSDEKGRRLSLSTWTPSIVATMSSRGKKNKDKEAFSALSDEPDGEAHGDAKPQAAPRSRSFSLTRKMSKKKKSKENVATPPLDVASRLEPPVLTEKRTVTAVYDFEGSQDELSFKAGTDIKVLNMVVDGWYMGEVDGKKGLFPTTHVAGRSPSLSPSIPHRPYRADGDEHEDEHLTSDLEEEFGHQLPLTHDRSPFYAGFNDVASVTSDRQEDSDAHPIVPQVARRFSDDFDDRAQPATTPKVRNSLLHREDGGDIATVPLLRSQSDGPPSPSVPTQTLTPRKMPPPPPPRRPSANAHGSRSPAIPPRKPGPSGGKPALPARPQASASSSIDSLKAVNNGSATSSALGTPQALDYDVSPFESAAELLTEQVSTHNGCSRFKPANPYDRARGMCANCKTVHVH